MTNCFTFLIKFWMLLVKKSRICGISVIFLQCFLWVKHKYEWQFLGIIFWKGTLLFNMKLHFKWEGVPQCPRLFSRGGGGGRGESKIISWDGGMTLPWPLHFPTMGNPEFKYYLVRSLVLLTEGCGYHKCHVVSFT